MCGSPDLLIPWVGLSGITAPLRFSVWIWMLPPCCLFGIVQEPLAACHNVKSGPGAHPMAFSAFPSIPTPLGLRQLTLPAAVYQDTLTQLPCYLQLFHGPMKFSQPLPPHLNVPQGAAAVLMVCASGESTQHSYRPCGKWCSQDTHSNPTWPQTHAFPVVLQQTNQSCLLTSGDLDLLSARWSPVGGGCISKAASASQQLCSLSPVGKQDLGSAQATQIDPSLHHSYFPRRAEDGGPSATSHQQHLWCLTA